MKKLIALILSIVFCLNLIPMVFAAKELSQNFETMEIGETQIGFDTGKNTETSIVEISADPFDETNKVLKFEHDGLDDRYIHTTGDFLTKSIIKFKFYQPEEGKLSVYFRDSLGTTNNIHIFSADGTTISSVNMTQKYDKSKWVTVQIALDARKDSISLYTDVQNGYNGEVKLVKTKSISEKYGTSYENHTFDNTTLRIGPMKKAGILYMDDISVTPDNSLTDNLFVSNVTVQKETSGKYGNISALKDGNLRISTNVIGSSDTPQTASMFFALYNSNGLMKQFAQSAEFEFVNGEIKTVTADMNISGIAEGDYIRAFLLDGKDNIKPLANTYEL